MSARAASGYDDGEEEHTVKTRSQIAVLLSMALLPAAASAQMTCTALGAHLATLPNIQPYVPPPPAAQVPVPFTQLIGTRCEANFIYSARGGPRDGYAVGQDQRIGIRVGFPLNSFDGGSGGVQGAWNGKVRNIGGGGLQGNLSAVTAATNTGYVGSNTDTGHPSSDNPNFAVIQETHELNEGRLDDFLNESLKQQYRWALQADAGLLRPEGEPELLGRLLDRRPRRASRSRCATARTSTASSPARRPTSTPACRSPRCGRPGSTRTSPATRSPTRRCRRPTRRRSPRATPTTA